MRGWKLASFLATASVVHTAAMLAICGLDEGLPRVLRTTPRFTVVYFTLAFAASALVRARPSPLTRWLFARRRPFGVAAAAAHAVHLACIVAIALRSEAWRDLQSPVFLIPGGAVYAFLFAMALTSNDASVRRLGPNWKRLHRVGGWLLWVAFMANYGAAAILRSPWDVPMALALLGIPILKIVNHRRVVDLNP